MSFSISLQPLTVSLLSLVTDESSAVSSSTFVSPDSAPLQFATKTLLKYGLKYPLNILIIVIIVSKQFADHRSSTTMSGQKHLLEKQ